MFLFEGSWLMILFSLNLASESLDLTVLQTVRIRSIACITKVPYFYLHIIAIVLLGTIVEEFIHKFIGRVNFCFEKFNFLFKCGNYSFINESFIFFIVLEVLFLFYFIFYKFTSLFISRSSISLFFLYLVFLYALSIRSNVTEELLSLFSTSLVTRVNFMVNSR